METLGKIVIVAVVAILLFVITMLVVGHFSEQYGWNVYFNVNDSQKAPYKEYVSGNSPEKSIYTNDHSLGQLYTTRLGPGDVPNDKILYTKMHVDESGYPNPTRRTDLYPLQSDENSFFNSTINAVDSVVNPNAAIIQPGTKVDYSISLHNAKNPRFEFVAGVEKGVKYSRGQGGSAVFKDDGTMVVTSDNGTIKTINADGTYFFTDKAGVSSSLLGKPTSNSNAVLFVSDKPDEQKTAPDDGSLVAVDPAKDGEKVVVESEGFQEFSKSYNSKRLMDNFIAGKPGNADPAGNPGTYSHVNGAHSRMKQGLDSGESAAVVAATTDSADDVVNSVGVAEQGKLEYIYEVELENVIVQDLYTQTSDTADLPAIANELGIDITGELRTQGMAVYPDRYYVDVAGNRVYRRRRRTSHGGWNGPYVDINGDIHYNGAFELVRGAYVVDGWSLPRHRRRDIKVRSIATWEPHNHNIRMSTNPRFFDSTFSAAASEFSFDNVLRHDHIGGLIVKPTPVYESSIFHE